MKTRIFALYLLICTGLPVTNSLYAQPVSPQLLHREWDAKWICVPGASANGYGVYLFRKKIDVRKVPSTCIIHVSADNRYKLYVNETQVSSGPARGDMYYWHFETVDIAPYLTEGNNIIAAKVWNDGEWRPEAQISWRTGFILQEDMNGLLTMNTNQTWKCVTDTSYEVLPVRDVPGYYVAGHGEFVDMRKNMSGWNKLAFNDSSWKDAGLSFFRGGSPKGLSDAFGWMLVPSEIPPMELSVQRFQTLRESTGVTVSQGFPAVQTPVVIPEHSRATLLIDQGYLTNAYPVLVFSNGRDASITLQYAESLFIPAHSQMYGTGAGGYQGHPEICGKGNRNEVKGKLFLGRKDSLVSDGTLQQQFSSLYWRTFRYVLLTVQTREDALQIDDLYSVFTGYPFVLNARFQSDITALQKILEIGWRTARQCAIETYMDCPYYEQLQYIGDTRIQAMISYYNTGDDRLARNAINQADHSRTAEGFTLSRHPSYSPQVIPTFSLWYIGMLRDYWMYRTDSLFVKSKIPGTRGILDFFHRYQQNDGSLVNVPYWNFTDWVDNPGWKSGVAPAGMDGTSSILDLQLLWAYQIASELEEHLGMKAYARIYVEEVARLSKTIRESYWDESKGLFADTREKTSFSQHANTLAILTGLITGDSATETGKKLMNDKTLTPASIYFKYYLHQALVKAGLGNDYISWLDIWNQNIKMGLTTWAESSDIGTARSDCHAWGASPNIEFYRVVLGIDSDAPGFSRVKIAPALGNMTSASGEIPHPKGTMTVRYSFEKDHWNVTISLPEGLTGTFIWEKKNYVLNQGINHFQL